MLELFRPSQYGYNPLSSTGDDGDEILSSKGSLDNLTRETPESAPPKQLRIALYSVSICILCALINVSALFLSRLHPSTFNLSLYELQSPLRTDLKNLRRPSQFIGLDKIERPFPPVHREIINFPLLVGRVDEANPWAVITSGSQSHRIIQDIEARKVEARGSISTVIQFRMIDWGMESCTLHIRLPSDSNADVTFGSNINQIDIYRLNSTTDIDIDSLSYRMRPPIGEKLATVNTDYGTNWRYQFACAMDSLHTFALVPITHLTSVEWWQDKQSESPAVYIIQHSTK